MVVGGAGARGTNGSLCHTDNVSSTCYWRFRIQRHNQLCFWYLSFRNFEYLQLSNNDKNYSDNGIDEYSIWGHRKHCLDNGHSADDDRHLPSTAGALMVCSCCQLPFNKCSKYAQCGVSTSGFFDNQWLFKCEPADAFSFGPETCSETTLATAPPYVCVNNAFQSGAWVTISGWKYRVFGSEGFEGDVKADIEATEAAINTTFFVPVDCAGYAYLALIQPVAHIYIYFFLCERAPTVSLYPALLAQKYNPGYGFDGDNRTANSGALPKVQVSCDFMSYNANATSGTPRYFCNCEGWSVLLTATRSGQTNSASFSVTG